MHDLRDFVGAVRRIIARHQRGAPGRYARWLWQDDTGGRDLEVNPYGCADAANLLYTIGELQPLTLSQSKGERDAWVGAVQALQDPASGWFREATHHPLHTTAHLVAALELFDARPTHRLRALLERTDAARVAEFLEELDWTWNPWGESHRGAGLYAALVLTGEVSEAWRRAYFDWLWLEADPASGFWRRGCVAPGGDAMLFHHLAGSFHYLFNHQHAGRRLRYPHRMIDSCLRIRGEGLFPPLGRSVGFAEIDWIYCLTRSMRETDHRARECRQALADFAATYTAFLLALDPETDDGLNDLHQLLGAVSALAELQQALPDTMRSEQPLRLVLDRRPFI